jgi:hypothetical protein
MKVIIVLVIIVLIILIIVYPTKEPERQVVYEFNIKNDPKWKKFWELFVHSCDTPVDYQKLPVSEMYKECFEPPDEEKYNRHEKMYKDRVRVILNKHWELQLGKYIRNWEKCKDCIMELRKILGSDEIVWRGNFLYPENGYREWHTNRYDHVGWRLYVIHTEGDAYFNYIHPDTGDLKKCRDKDGTVRLFYLSDRDVLWHTVASKGKRYSLGARLPDKIVNKLIRRLKP